MSSPRTLTKDEQRRILKVTAEHTAGFRDHVIITMALLTGLRQHEIVALDVGDVFDVDGNVRRVVQLHTYKKSSKDPLSQCVFITHDGLRDKLAKLYRQKARAGHDMGAAAPLFVSREGTRLSKSRVGGAFRRWQQRAGFDRRVRFHDLRHTACTRYLEVCGGNLAAVKKFARHASVTSTQIYTHVSDDYQAESVKKM